MRRAVAVLLSLSCLLAASTLLAAPASADRARAPRTELYPRTAARGPNPRVAYYDRRSHRIHEGARSVAVRFPGLFMQLADVRGGWVTVNQEPDLAATTTFRFVNRLGRSRVLARESYANLNAVSADGRRIALLHGRGPPHPGRAGGRRRGRLTAVQGRGTGRRAGPGPCPGGHRHAHRVVDAAHPDG